MDPALQKYYEERLSMMGSIGWKQLMEDVNEMYEATNRLDGVTVDNFHFKQGELSIMRWLLSLKNVSEQTYEGLQNEDNG